HSDLTSKCDLSETLWSTPPPQRCLHRRSVEDTWKRALDPGSTSETMRRTAPQNVRKSPCAVRRPGVRSWHQELNWCPSRPATAVFLCGLGFPQLPDHQAVRSPMPHKWEGNIRAEMLSTTFLPFAFPHLHLPGTIPDLDIAQFQ